MAFFCDTTGTVTIGFVNRKVKVKTLPFPNVELAKISPPIRSTIDLKMGRPRPVPPNSLDTEAFS